jgi:heme exporter protein D
VWANSIYNTDERLYHGSDFGVLASSGLLSAEFENSGSATRHHRPGDTVEAINPSIVQDHGDTMLTLARYFGNLDLSRAHSSSEDLVFFTLPGFGLVAYPTWLATGLSVVAVVLLVAVIVAARRRARLSLARLAWGTLASLAVVLVSVAIAAGIWELLLAMHPEAEELSYPDFEGSGLAMTAIYVVAASAFIAVMHALSRSIGAVELTAGALLWWAVIDITLGLFAPLASVLAIWPLLGGTAALVVVTFLQRSWAAALVALAAVPSLVLLFVPLIVLNALQPEDGAAEPVAILLLILGTLIVQLMLITGRLPAEVKD